MMCTNKNNGPVDLLVMLENTDYSIRRYISDLLMINYDCFNVIHVEDPKQSLVMLQKHKPDLFIVDLETGDLGIQLIQIVNALRFETNLLVTGELNPEKICISVMNGAIGYIMTPIDPRAMIKTIDDALATVTRNGKRQQWCRSLRVPVQGKGQLRVSGKDPARGPRA